jgi:quercetin dioxygenase-like cupin family protein
MPIRPRFPLAAAVVAAVLLTASVSDAQQPPYTRTVLLRQDLPMAGYEALLVDVEIAVGGREGRHMHPGTLLVRVDSGELTLDYEGKPTVTYKAGESFIVAPGNVHEGINRGSVPVKATATFIVEKGKPLTVQVE